jgi:cell wall assembly regulator SMI1
VTTKKTIVIGGATEANIDAAQEAVGVRFPPSYIEFLRLFNGGEFRYLRLHRIGEDKMVEEMGPYSGYEYVGDLVGYVRETDNFLANWERPEDEDEANRFTNPFYEGVYARRFFPIGDDFGGNYFCFDLTQERENGEYPVLQWEHELWNRLPEGRASSFTDLLAIVYSDD